MKNVLAHGVNVGESLATTGKGDGGRGSGEEEAHQKQPHHRKRDRDSLNELRAGVGSLSCSIRFMVKC